ncbi:hypothetical protein HMPREF0576_0812 [Mobiluncus holmesii ATCC 35242]|uniref:Uncharacterized protein n=1 Tax=Mobiluncus holmesii ATCC 35242 TaxID=887899 RepID=E6M3A7_9ACTO|nr:hypothetical protein HMPREF0576_0812 [Mobiluncus holmesii ATCC 35242]
MNWIFRHNPARPKIVFWRVGQAIRFKFIYTFWGLSQWLSPQNKCNF